MKFKFLVLIVGITFFGWSQKEGNIFHKADSLLEINQPNAVQKELWRIVEKAKLQKDNASLVKSLTYFKNTIYAIDDEEKATLYFRLFTHSESFPEPAKSISQVLLLKELDAFYPWFSYRYISLYDSLDVSNVEVRAEFLIYHSQQLEERLPDLTESAISPFMEVLNLEKDKKLYGSIADYLSYSLIDLYQSSTIRSGGKLKKERTEDALWYATSDEFIQLNFGENLTEKTLFLFQNIEKNNQDNPEIRSSTVYNRIHFLLNEYSPENKVEVWESHFTSFKNSSARSKFLFEREKIRYKEGKEYHFKEFPEKENLIKEAHENLQKELVQYPENSFETEIKDLLSIIENKEIGLQFPNQVSPGQKIPFLIKSRNLSQQYLYLYAVENPDLLTIKSFREYLKSNQAKLVRKEKIELVDKGLFQERSTEFLQEKITSPGLYFWISTNDELDLKDLANQKTEDWNAKEVLSQSMIVTEISANFIMENNAMTVVVMDRKTGEPKSKAKVEVYYTKYDRLQNRQINDILTTGTTNKDGIFQFDYDKFLSFSIVVSAGKSKIKTYTSVYKEAASKETKHVQLFTDRKIYRPGQTVYFKGIAYEGKENNFAVSRNKKVTINILNSSSQEVFKKSFFTNEFGSFDGSFQLPLDVPLGNFVLTEDDFSSYSNNLLFSVEEYKRPTFEVVLNQPEKETKLAEEINLKGTASAFAGYGISGAQVTYSVYRNWHTYWRFYHPGVSGGDLLKQDTLTTDNEGDFAIHFFAEKDPNAEKNAYYSYVVTVKVTDISGETQEKTITIPLNEVGYSLQVNLPTRWLNHEKDSVSMEVVNLAGKTQSNLQGKLIIYREGKEIKFLPRIWGETEKTQFTAEEYAKIYPYRSWKDFTEKPTQEVPFKTIMWKSGEKFSLQELVGSQEGEFIFKVEVITEKGDTLKSENTLSVIDVESKKMPFKTSLWSFVSSEEVKVGESVNYQVGSSFSSAKALVTISRNGKIISREWKKLNERTSICYELKEEDRGGIVFSALIFENGIFYTDQKRVNVPFDNKELKIKTLVFRDKLQPGEKEKWSFIVQDKDGKFKKTELAATMYDASLDRFRSNSWEFSLYSPTFPYTYWRGDLNDRIIGLHKGGLNYLSYQLLNDSYSKYRFSGRNSLIPMPSEPAYSFLNKKGKEEVFVQTEALDGTTSPMPEVETEVSEDNTFHKQEENKLPKLTVSPRSNFNETAFFYPIIRANKEEYILEFTLPESLTKWKLLLLAHNEELQIGTLQKEIIAQKELMVTANIPRFVREKDKMDFASKVVNLTDEEQEVTVSLELKNPINEVELNWNTEEIQKVIIVPANSSKDVKWRLHIGEEELIEYTLIASTSSFSDGEKNLIPVLSNRVLITETSHTIIKEKGKTTLQFDHFVNQDSPTLKSKSYTLDYTDNLIGNVLKSLPYLAKQEDQSLISMVNSYYANAIAAYILAEYPKLEIIFNRWKNKTPDAFLSELEKNEEVKNILLNETPWVVEAKDETEQRRRIAVLFELNQLKNTQNNLLLAIQNAQNRDGGFSWFKEGESNRYITQQIVMRIGQLQKMGVEINPLMDVVEKAQNYLDAEQLKNYKKWQESSASKKEEFPFSTIDLHWLYMRSLLKTETSKELSEVIENFQIQLKKEWTKYNPYEQSMAGIYFQKEGFQKEADLIYTSLLDRAKKNTNLGMYWVENSGYFWYQNKISTQAMVIQFFKEMKASEELMTDARFWLILNKETNSWKTNIQTADAISAILLTGQDYLKMTPAPKIMVGNKELVYRESNSNKEIEVEYTEGMGEVKKTWHGEEIVPELGVISIEKFNEAPGALSLFWQYTEELDKVNSNTSSSLQIEKKLKRIIAGDKKEKGEETTSFTIGDKIEVELIVTVDRDLEYVYIKDLRPAGFEPVKNTSGYSWGRRDISYYQSPKDASMDFFVEYLAKGTYKIAYTVYATHSGEFNSGLASIQCLYAPAHAGHSGTVKVEIGR